MRSVHSCSARDAHSGGNSLDGVSSHGDGREYEIIKQSEASILELVKLFPCKMQSVLIRSIMASDKFVWRLKNQCHFNDIVF